MAQSVVELHSAEEAVEFVSGFYPQARVSGRLVLGIRELWRIEGTLTVDHPDGSPQ